MTDERADAATGSDGDRLRLLMTEYQAGRMDAFDELYSRLAPAVRRYFRAHRLDAARVDDLTQDTFLQLHRARHTYDAAFPVHPWALAIARHVWLMHCRTMSRRPRPTDDVEALQLPVSAEAERYAERMEVRAALRELPESRRRAVIWHHLFGLSFREIAGRTGGRESAAKLRSSRGVAQLRALLRRGRSDE